MADIPTHDLVQWLRTLGTRARVAGGNQEASEKFNQAADAVEREGRMREALAFYADTGRYKKNLDPRSRHFQSPIQKDGGEKARAALKDTDHG